MKYRAQLPQLNGTPMITDGGLETVFIFEKGIDIPGFASFTLFDREDGLELLNEYLSDFVRIADENGTGLILDTNTWRANPDWGEKLGLDRKDLTRVIEISLEETEKFRKEHERGGLPRGGLPRGGLPRGGLPRGGLPRGCLQRGGLPIAISGCIGPRSDGYSVGARMSSEESAAYHGFLMDHFKDSPVDYAAALTMNYVEEAVGIIKAASDRGIPVVISFTVETDGRLPSGQSLGDAIQVCDAMTDSYCSYFMINCAHPTHFFPALQSGEGWIERIRGIRANASKLSHAELDEAEELDDGNPVELGRELRDIFDLLPHLSVFGGCCGTDKRHVEEIAKNVVAQR